VAEVLKSPKRQPKKKVEGKQMKVFKSNKTWLTATLQKIGTMFLVTIGRIKKLFDNEQTAIAYINNLGYQF
jgi:hypothetical protein